MPEQKIKVRLKRPLDGKDIGAVATFDRPDAERLAGYGAVEILGPARPPKAKKQAARVRNQAAPPRRTQAGRGAAATK